MSMKEFCGLDIMEMSEWIILEGLQMDVEYV